MFDDGIISAGQEFSISASPIRESTLFSIRFTAENAFLQNERIQVLAGAGLSIRSHVDDMESFVAARTTWRVNTIEVAMR